MDERRTAIFMVAAVWCTVLALPLSAQEAAREASLITATPDTLKAILAKASPGDSIVLSPGTYKAGLELSRSGSDGNPISIRAATTGCLVEAEGAEHGLLITGSHVVVEGLSIHGGNLGILVSGARNVVVRNCRVYGSRDCGIRLLDVSMCAVELCDVSAAKRLSGINVLGASSDVEVKGNLVHANQLGGIMVSNETRLDTPQALSKVNVLGNIIWGNCPVEANGIGRGAAVALVNANSCLVADNLMYDNSCHGVAFYAAGLPDWTEAAASNCDNTVSNNRIIMKKHQGQDCVYVRLSGRTRFRQNLLIGGQFGVVNMDDMSADSAESDLNTVLQYPEHVFVGDQSEGTGEMRDSWIEAGRDIHSAFDIIPACAAAGSRSLRLPPGPAAVIVAQDLSGSGQPTQSAQPHPR